MRVFVITLQLGRTPLDIFLKVGLGSVAQRAFLRLKFALGVLELLLSLLTIGLFCRQCAVELVRRLFALHRFDHGFFEVDHSDFGSLAVGQGSGNQHSHDDQEQQFESDHKAYFSFEVAGLHSKTSSLFELVGNAQKQGFLEVVRH